MEQIQETKVVVVSDNDDWTCYFEGQPYREEDSFLTLKHWLFNLGVRNYEVLYAEREGDLNNLEKLYEQGAKIIVLGGKALWRTHDLGIETFKLPHPRTRPKNLRQRIYLDTRLKKCKKWLKGEL